MELNEYTYKLTDAGYLHMTDTETGELVVRVNANELLSTTACALGVKGFRMIEGDELNEVLNWLDAQLGDKIKGNYD